MTNTMAKIQVSQTHQEFRGRRSSLPKLYIANHVINDYRKKKHFIKDKFFNFCAFCSWKKKLFKHKNHIVFICISSESSRV